MVLRTKKRPSAGLEPLVKGLQLPSDGGNGLRGLGAVPPGERRFGSIKEISRRIAETMERRKPVVEVMGHGLHDVACEY